MKDSLPSAHHKLLFAVNAGKKKTWTIFHIWAHRLDSQFCFKLESHFLVGNMIKTVFSLCVDIGLRNTLRARGDTSSQKYLRLSDNTYAYARTHTEKDEKRWEHDMQYVFPAFGLVPNREKVHGKKKLYKCTLHRFLLFPPFSFLQC